MPTPDWIIIMTVVLITYFGGWRGTVRENQRISMRIDLEVLKSVDHIMTTSTSK